MSVCKRQTTKLHLPIGNAYELCELGIKFLFKKLQKIDSISSEKINCNDSQRILRALEVYYISGKPLSSFYKDKIKSNLPGKVLKLALFPSRREELHKIIKLRTESMITSGLVDEVENILKKYPDLNETYPSIKSVGYRQTYHYLKNKISKKELNERIIFATRQLAKRQITWMRKMENLDRFEPYSKDLNFKVKSRVEEFLLN